MVISCSAYNCTMNYNKAGEIVKFHSFPLKNKELLQKWLHALRRDHFVPNQNSKLCSLYFCSTNYNISIVNEKPVLKNDAVPLVFDFPAHLPKKVCRRVLQRSSTENSTNLDDCSNSTTALVTNVGEKTTADAAVQTNVVGSQQEAIIANLRRDKKLLQMKLRHRNLKSKSLTRLHCIVESE